MEKTKRCAQCEKTKPASAFWKCKRWKDGLQYACKTCLRPQVKATPRDARNSRLRRQYGITIEDYEEMLASQEGKCAICGTTTPWPKGKYQNFCIDHDHESGKIRGLLCGSCNPGLGSFKDNPELLRKAARYLDLSKATGSEDADGPPKKRQPCY